MNGRIHYPDVALRIVGYGYEVVSHSSLELSEMVECVCGEDEIEYLHPDNDGQRHQRLSRLQKHIELRLQTYDARRIRAPLYPTPGIPGAWTATFADEGLSLDGDSPALRRRMRLVPVVIASLLDLTPVGFEKMCADILALVGCDAITVTPSSKDDGVDAIARLRFSSVLRQGTPLYTFAGHLSFLVYAQAKRYTKPVQQDVVKQVDGSWHAMLNKYADNSLTADQASSLERADFHAADPVLKIVLASSRFTSGAENTAKVLGVILMDGEQIAQLLLGASVGVVQESDGTLRWVSKWT